MLEMIQRRRLVGGGGGGPSGIVVVELDVCGSEAVEVVVVGALSHPEAAKRSCGNTQSSNLGVTGYTSRSLAWL